MSTAADLHTLTGAYAAHALPETESLAFERHLAQCPACALEVQEFRAALARLGSAETTRVPPELKARVMAGIGSVRQLGPGEPLDERGSGAGGSGRLARTWPRFALAASVAVAVGLGGVAVSEHRSAEQAQRQSAQLQQQAAAFGSLLTAPDARTRTAKAGAGVGTVVWSESLDQAGFLAASLPQLPKDKVYELWFNDSGTMRPAGLMPVSTGSMLLSGPIDGAVGIGVTVEPAGGSPQPTGAPVMLMPFA
ncbi:anti-sigma factor domain-containing protein [Kitasatospora sp. NPDC057015]|uniref:anti-sigma factor n=1 Tax=Kitasatospora sp. NPDC057015 TaxID=3346001 RepID=UPI00362A8EA4